MNIKRYESIDITGPKHGIQIEVQTRSQFNNNNRVLYVHVDGVTVLRICRIPDSMVIADHSKGPGQIIKVVD